MIDDTTIKSLRKQVRLIMKKHVLAFIDNASDTSVSQENLLLNLEIDQVVDVVEEGVVLFTFRPVITFDSLLQMRRDGLIEFYKDTAYKNIYRVARKQ